MAISNLYSFLIDSKLRTSGNDHDFTFKIDLDNELRKKITHCAISYISIPKSYYLIDDYNNKFYLYEDLSNPIEIIIETGNYSRSQIRTKLKNKLNENTLNNIIYDVIDAYTDRETGKIKITSTNNLIQKKLIFTNEINEIFGFNFNQEYIFNDFLISDHPINLSQENTLYISSNICQNLYNSNGSSYHIAVIYTGMSQPFSYIVEQYDIIQNMKTYINQETFKFSLVNENNQLINTNSINMSFILNLFTYSNINSKISNYIDYRILNDK